MPAALKGVVVQIAQDPVQRWIDDLPEPIDTTYPPYEDHTDVAYVPATGYRTATADADRPVVATDRLQTCVAVLLTGEADGALLAHAPPATMEQLTTQLTDGYDELWADAAPQLEARYVVGSSPCPRTLDTIDAARDWVDDLTVTVDEALIYSTVPGDQADRPAGTIAYDTRSQTVHTYRKPYRAGYGVTVIPDGSTWNGE